MGRDVRTEREWLDLAADLLDAPLTELPAARIATALNATFDLVGSSFNDRSPGLGALRLWPREEHLARQLQDLAEWRIEHPLAVFYAATRCDVPAQIADIPSDVVGSGIRSGWLEYARPRGSEQVLLLPLRSHHRAFALARPTVFTPAETVAVARVWRLVRGLDRQVTAFAAARPDLPDLAARVRGATVPDDELAASLTPRQTAVLGLVARGLTSAAVARRLGISERTVHKHLERAYAALGVSDRLSAVLHVQRAGLIATDRTHPVRRPGRDPHGVR